MINVISCTNNSTPHSQHLNAGLWRSLSPPPPWCAFRCNLFKSYIRNQKVSPADRQNLILSICINIWGCSWPFWQYCAYCGWIESIWSVQVTFDRHMYLWVMLDAKLCVMCSSYSPKQHRGTFMALALFRRWYVECVPGIHQSEWTS